jgi:predicted RNA binding protein with dsRBD fold (UPF0201 family)
MAEVVLQLEVDVNPTESEEKVRRAVWNLFGDMPTSLKPARRGDVLVGEGKSREVLVTLRNLLKRDRIRDAARKVLYHSLRGNTFTIYLNKQAAFAGHVSFSEAEAESPLGPIRVTVQSEDPDALLDWLASKTAGE